MSTSKSILLFKNFDRLYVGLRSHLNAQGHRLTSDVFVLLCCVGACGGGSANSIHGIFTSNYSPVGYRSFIRRLTSLVDSGLVERYHLGTDGRYRRYRLSRACLSLVRRSVGSDVLASFSMQPKND